MQSFVVPNYWLFSAKLAARSPARQAPPSRPRRRIIRQGAHLSAQPGQQPLRLPEQLAGSPAAHLVASETESAVQRLRQLIRCRMRSCRKGLHQILSPQVAEVHLQPAGAAHDVLSFVGGAPALGEADLNAEVVDGSHVAMSLLFHT